MQARVLRLSIAAAAAVAVAVPVDGKAPVERITISGGGLSERITVADKETLDLSNPWHGRIANWSADVSPPPVGRPVYDITLHARLRGPEIRGIYQLRYVKGEGGAPGAVYLPGRGEPWYTQNVSIIYREGHDGHWHVATSAWEAAIQRGSRSMMMSLEPSNNELQRTRPAASRWSLAAELSVGRTRSANEGPRDCGDRGRKRSHRRLWCA